MGRAQLLEKHPWLVGATICDGLLPWSKLFLPPGARLGEQMERFWGEGFDHISLTAAAGKEDAEAAMARLGFLKRELAAMGTQVRVATTAEEIRAASAAGVLSVSFHFQSAVPFTSDLALVEGFAAAGIFRAILAYNEANIFADGCHEPRNAGLSEIGRRLVRRMDETGMIVDLSHCGERTSFDAMEMGLSRPPIFSHSNARALYDHERNITDAQIKACAAGGGYVGVNGVGMFLGAGLSGIPTEMARHAAHIAALIGPERVGVGNDFMFLENSDYAFFHQAGERWPRGYPSPPWDFFQPEQLPALIDAFGDVGFSAQEIRGILGENYLRLAVPAAAEP